MARPRRVDAASGFYHVINRSVRQAIIFKTRRDFIAFLAVLREGLARYNAPLVSYYVLGNHWHLLIGPIARERLSRLMQWVTTTHPVRWHRFRGTTGTGAVYRGRFTATPIHEIAAIIPLARYVERNARSAGLVARAEEWRWCSLSQRRRHAGFMPLSSARVFHTDAWVHYVNLAMTQREIERDRQFRERSDPACGTPVDKGSRCFRITNK